MLDLNPEQKIAADHVEGPLLVLAGAGSGKTRIVTARVGQLLSLGVPSSQIVAVTFTNKAAEEMRSRINQLTNQAVLTCTFHSLGVRILRESIKALGFDPQFHIYDADDSLALVKSCLKSMDVKDEKGLAKALKSGISFAKNELKKPGELTVDFAETKADELLPAVYTMYQQKLKEYNALDFDDLLFLCVELFEKHPEVLERYQKRWRFFLIDEYQDTNRAQYLMSKYLTERSKNLFVVGDPDQSIYSWRGANIQNILNFENDFPGARVVTLDQNYRSTSHILTSANKLIENNTRQYEKNLWSNVGEGQKVGYFLGKNDREEAQFVIEKILQHKLPLNDCVIFYRTNFQSRLLEDALLSYDLPYTIIGGISFYQRREIKDLLAYLRMIVSDSDFISFARTLNLPKRGIGPTTLAKLKAASEEEQMPILTFCRDPMGVKLSARQKAGLDSYLSIIENLRGLLKGGALLNTLLREAVEQSGYLDYLKGDPETLDDRKANLEELISKAAEWQEERENPSLSGFLEELSLKTTADEKSPHDESIRMMTLHNGKGLEFPLVFIVGMEEDLFPHANSKGSFDAIEEERRLCYVGMTRAKQFLYLTASEYRFLWGTSRFMRPSRFLKEIPREHLHLYHDEEESDNYEFDEGDVVFHKDFGRGIIQKAYQGSLGLTYDVLFPDEGQTRSLVAKYARLSNSSIK